MSIEIAGDMPDDRPAIPVISALAWRIHPELAPDASACLHFIIRLRIKGADIRILDVYYRPLYVIRERILACSEHDGSRTVGPLPRPDA